MRKPVLVLTLFALVLFAVGACGGDDDDEPTAEVPVEEPAPDHGDATTVEVSAPADGSLEFEQDSLEAPAGEITFEFENRSSMPHDFVIEDADGNELAGTEVITQATDSVTVDLEPGEYTFYCSVPGHREAGQTGPLAVE